MKSLVKIPIAYFAPGKHRLILMVANLDGPPLVRVRCNELAIKTGDGWLASSDQQHWSNAVPVDLPWEPALTTQFPSTGSYLKRFWLLQTCCSLREIYFWLLVLDPKPPEVIPIEISSAEREPPRAFAGRCCWRGEFWL